jgi:hypothetical protein
VGAKYLIVVFYFIAYSISHDTSFSHDRRIAVRALPREQKEAISLHSYSNIP